MPARLLFANCLHPTEANVGQSLSTTGDASKCTFGKVNDATAVKWAPVVPTNDYGTAIVLIDDFDSGSEWQASMGEGKGLRIETFTIGRCAPVEAGAVVASDAA